MHPAALPLRRNPLPVLNEYEAGWTPQVVQEILEKKVSSRQQGLNPVLSSQ